MEKKHKLHLFEAYGVELEYMIVDRQSLNVKPYAEVLLKDESGNIDGEVAHGMTSWSNELVSHVIEIKSNGPTSDLVKLHARFHADIRMINEQLHAFDAQLMPTAAHPWMDPASETALWSHDSHEIYHAYDRIFNCKGHGWSNLQSMHINLPFYDDNEFARLHTAIRFLLPLIPALTASSPILDGKFTGFMDKRLDYYERNQSKLPVLTGKVIPDRFFSRHSYHKHVYDRIASAILPHDPGKILQPMWLNSRGAIARFDRGSVEIRIIDIQECPFSDMAIAVLVIHLLKKLTAGKWISFDVQKSFETEELYHLYRGAVKYAGQTVIENPGYLQVLGYQKPTSGREIWSDLIKGALSDAPDELDEWKPALNILQNEGSMAERIITCLGEEFTPSDLHGCYTRLGNCLQENVPFST